MRKYSLKNILVHMSLKGYFNFLSDKKYLKLLYRLHMNEKLNLDQPQTFNEKLQWLKLYDRKPEYTKMVDKYKVREYIKEKIGEKYLIPLLGVWDSFEDIDFSNLPNQFVLKCTHDSGGLVICKNKNKFDIEKAKKKINKCLKRNFYYVGREWPYKNVNPKIIAEQYMEDIKEKDIKDYKLFCFNGRVETILVCSNRKGTYKNTDFYNKEWNKMPFTRKTHENNIKGNKKPLNLEKMIEISEILSKEIPFVRVDLYEINGKVYFGELTFFPSSGFEGFSPEEWDGKLGHLIKLPKKKIK